ncbi:MAG: hypothetical protein CSB46_05825 [Micrococcales bacterium]|nr:MAG: hypothetical protein CSB46_05825 [Micrococcales bacterium]
MSISTPATRIRAGVTRFSGCLDLRDARDLHAALIAGAETMKARAKDEGLDIEPLEVRKSRVMGDMARAYLGWLADDNDHGQLRGLPRDLNLYVHLNLTDLLGPSRLGLARVANEGDRLITAEQVRRWAGEPGTKVVVKPVIDLAEHVRVTQYEVPDRVKERVHLRDGTCVFPHCTRPAHRCDTDHSEAYNHAEPDSGGATCPCNLAPLCRRHHNLKTHHGWRYRRISSEGNDLRPVYLWTSPGGRSYLRDERGTASLQ